VSATLASFSNFEVSLSFTSLNSVSSFVTMVLEVFRELSNSRTDKAFSIAKAWNAEVSWTSFSSGSSPSFYSNILPTDDLYMVSSPPFLLFDLFSILLILLS
jgi:hypothetical protein